jgi:hypothetical protein
MRLGVLGLVVLAAAGCRASGASQSDPPPWIDLGAGSPDRIAQRAAIAIVDSPAVADGAPRVGAQDRRYAMVLDEGQQADAGALAHWRQIVRHAVTQTGRILLAGTGPADAATLRASCSDPLERGEARVEVFGPDGRLLLRARGVVARSP